MTQQAGDNPGGWAGRRLPGDNGRPRVTNGAVMGIGGVRLRGWAWLAVVGLLALVIFVNVMTEFDDAHRRGVAMPLSLPLTLEITSAIAAILRVPVLEILAARAARNYVEFALEDGRRPLMRASMAEIETALAPHGFVRTHRSWLINAERVRALSAAGSGDFRLDLVRGLTAPLSRRYPAALARLRDGP